VNQREGPGQVGTGVLTGTGPGDGSQPPLEPHQSRWQRLMANRNFRRAFGCLVGFVVLAVMLGPTGSATAPLSGITGSLFSPRVLIFIGLAVASWSIITAQARYGARARQTADRITSAPRRLVPNRRARHGLYIAALAIAVVVPMHISSYWQGVLVEQVGIYVLLALGLNVVVGFAGLLDLGYVAFYAIGAYTAAYWSGALPVHPPITLSMFWIIPFAVLAAMLAGVVLGTPTLRLRGDYLAIVTLGFGEIIEIVATNLGGFTGGAQGVLGIPHFRFDLLGLHYFWGISQLPYYYLLLGFVVLSMLAFWLLDNSRIGRVWSAIREDEVAAESSGINVLKYKVMAFAIGASTAGFAGLLTASQISYINPGDFTVQVSILVLVLVIFGGMGSIWGAVIGAALIEYFQWFLQVHPLFGYQPQDLYMYLGALLVLMMIFRPEGIVPSRRRKREIGLAESGVGTADALSEPVGQAV
jgi:branched-chain amino acid transport system permease protein